jgi:hypothetical protein
VSDAVAKLSNTLALVTRGQRHTRELPELGGSFEGTGQPKQSIKRVNESLQVVNGLKEGAGDARLARKKCVWNALPSGRARRRGEGKKLTGLDGLRVLRTLLRCRLRGG